MSSKKRGRESSSEPSKKVKSETKEYRYLTGFGNEHSSEALKDALPKAQNTPQKCPYNLRAELVSGSPFTAPRKENQRTWVYRILPSAKQGEFKEVKDLRDYGAVFGSFADRKAVPNQFRWKPFPMTEKPKNFIQGLNTLGGAGAAELKTGMAVHIYSCNQSMKDTAFCNSDGDFLIVPQEGELNIRTELGWLRVGPGSIAVIQRGWRWSVDVTGPSRGYVAEIFESHFRLPELGPIGSNGLANPRDFEHPVADYEESSSPFHIIQKFGGNFFAATLDHSPFDVVAWHGNYVPYRYDLSKFCPVNATLYDHLDPSIFTVLTAQTAVGGTAVCDFVIFPPRWAVQEHTFRPPYYHRNCMSEFMGNIRGRYEAKPTGFLPGGATLHSIFAPHGPDAESYGKAVESDTSKPVRLPDDSLAFMFESTYMLRLTEWALKDELLDLEYVKHGWGPLTKEFSPSLTPSTTSNGTSSSSSSTSSSSSSSK